MNNYDTVVEAINDLIKRGYTIDLNIAFDRKLCVYDNLCLDPKEFEIIETYRFEGNSNPDDEDVVYAMASKDKSKKGIFTGAFGIYANSIAAERIHDMTTLIK